MLPLLKTFQWFPNSFWIKFKVIMIMETTKTRFQLLFWSHILLLTTLAHSIYDVRTFSFFKTSWHRNTSKPLHLLFPFPLITRLIFFSISLRWLFKGLFSVKYYWTCKKGHPTDQSTCALSNLFVFLISKTHLAT